LADDENRYGDKTKCYKYIRKKQFFIINLKKFGIWNISFLDNIIYYSIVIRVYLKMYLLTMRLKLELDKASKTIHILLVYIFAVIPNNIR
jgi:hypothetical protein